MRGRNGGPKVKKRIWRGLGFPRDFDISKFTSPRMNAFPLDLPGYTLTHHRGKGFQVLMESPCPIKTRETVVAIHAGADLVGYIELVEFKFAPTADNAEIAYWFDAYSAYYGEMAIMLISQWRDVEADVAAFGPIVLFDNVWIRNDHARNGLWKPVARELLELLFNRRSIVIFKPFPLEYEGLGDLAPVGFKRRTAAVTRLAVRFAAARVFDRAPDCGWYWVPRPDISEIITKNARRLAVRENSRLGFPAAVRWNYEDADVAGNDNYD